MDQLSLILSALEETGKKVSSTVLQSVDDHVNNNKFDSKKDSLDFLEAKNGIMLSYLIDLTQLLRLRTSKEKNVEEVEECLNRLREMRIILEKVRPLEKKMRYQLDKLLALSASSSSFAAATDNSPDEEKSQNAMKSDVAIESDPLAYRPNLELMDGREDENEDESADSENDTTDDDDDLMAAKMAFKAGSRKDDEDSQLYRAPRLAAVPFSESKTKSEKEERLMKRQRDRMRKSELLSTLKSTFGDAPEEDDFGGGAIIGKQRESAQRLAEKEAEKTRYEEDAMIRLGTSRKDKKMKNRIMREEISNLNTISDLGNLTTGVSVAFGDGDRGSSKGGGKNSILEGSASSRYANGKRRRDFDEFGGEGATKKGGKRRDPKNSFQKALYGVSASGSKKKKSRK